MTKPVALITGASKGIGASCARALHQLGMHVAIHYRSGEAEAQALAAELPGAEIFGYNLSEEASAAELINAVKTKFGGIDVLVNNAGIAIDQVITFAKPSDFDLLLATNLKPVFLLSKFASKLMIRKKQGSIINLSSVVGYSGNGGQSMYSATKAAITGLTKSMAIDLAPFGIRANCVAPGFIRTQMTDGLPEQAKEGLLARIPMGRMGETSEVAAAVAFLASAQSSYITGTTIHVNGGMYTS